MADAAPNKPFLRHKKTGDVYVYNSILAKRDDMEQTDEGPTAPPAQPARIMTAAVAAAANAAPSYDAELAALRARVKSLERDVAALKEKRDTVSPPTTAAAAPAPQRRRRVSPAAATANTQPPAQLDIEDIDESSAANIAAMEELMNRANSAVGKG